MSRPIRLFQGDRELSIEEQPLQLATRSGDSVSNFEGQLLRPNGERRDVMITSTPLFDERGKVRGGIAAIVDISERKNAEARQQVLLYELQHRVKNIIATISALASRMLRSEGAPNQFAEAFVGRMRGMAAAHELLARANWHGTQLSELIDAALRSHVSLNESAVRVHGPDVLMTPNAAATLGMVFYELATNAVKYGALSDARGRVDIGWQLVGAPQSRRVSLLWSESGGKRVDPHAPAGFGTSFIKHSVEYELLGKTEMEPMPDGVRWRLEFPLGQNAQRT
jgi:two-component system CheB/CheR fusion protein